MQNLRILAVLLTVLLILLTGFVTFILFSAVYTKEPAHCGGTVTPPAPEVKLSPEAQSGKTLFIASCSSCHTIGKGVLTGPDLKGLMHRRPEKWIIAYVQDAKKLQDKGDSLALAVKKENGDFNFNHRHSLSEQEVGLLLAYISAY